MEKTNVLKNTRNLTGAIIMSSPPAVSYNYDIIDSTPNKPFFLKIHNDAKNTGAFILNGIQCKLADGNLVLDITIHENGKFYNNANSPVIDSGVISIWDNVNKVWIDATTTADIIKKNSEYRHSWLILSKKLEKKFKYSKTESRKCFRTLKVYGVEELIRWLEFFKESSPSKTFVKAVLDIAISKKEVSKYFDFPCMHLEGAKEAMRHYIES